MKRVLEAGVVVVASLGIVLSVAGPASAQTPYGKYRTKAICVSVGNAFVQSDQSRTFECTGPHAVSGAASKWWLYLI